MLNFNLQCFHHDEEADTMKAFDMTPSTLLEFDRIVFKCPECEREVFLIITLQSSERKAT